MISGAIELLMIYLSTTGLATLANISSCFVDSLKTVLNLQSLLYNHISFLPYLKIIIIPEVKVIFFVIDNTVRYKPRNSE